MLREPSAPTRNRQRTSCDTPSPSVKWMTGVSPVMSDTEVSRTPNRTSAPAAVREAARSSKTEVCGYSHTDAPTRSAKWMR
jgi:hypothetical protein